MNLKDRIKDYITIFIYVGGFISIFIVLPIYWFVSDIQDTNELKRRIDSYYSDIDSRYKSLVELNNSTINDIESIEYDLLREEDISVSELDGINSNIDDINSGVIELKNLIYDTSELLSELNYDINIDDIESLVEAEETLDQLGDCYKGDFNDYDYLDDELSDIKYCLDEILYGLDEIEDLID